MKQGPAAAVVFDVLLSNKHPLMLICVRNYTVMCSCAMSFYNGDRTRHCNIENRLGFEYG